MASLANWPPFWMMRGGSSSIEPILGCLGLLNGLCEDSLGMNYLSPCFIYTLFYCRFHSRVFTLLLCVCNFELTSGNNLIRLMRYLYLTVSLYNFNLPLHPSVSVSNLSLSRRRCYTLNGFVEQLIANFFYWIKNNFISVRFVVHSHVACTL